MSGVGSELLHELRATKGGCAVPSPNRAGAAEIGDYEAAPPRILVLKPGPNLLEGDAIGLALAEEHLVRENCVSWSPSQVEECPSQRLAVGKLHNGGHVFLTVDVERPLQCWSSNEDAIVRGDPNR